MAVPAIAVKIVLKTAVRNPGLIKKAIKLICIITLIIVLLPAVMLQTIASLFGEKSIDENFNIRESEVYKLIQPIYSEYLSEVNRKMEAEAQQIRDENTTEDEEGNTTCTVEVLVTLYEDNLASLFSYLSLKDSNIMKSEKYKAEQAAIYDFYDRVCSIKIDQPDSDTYYIYNQFLTPEEIAKLYFPEDTTNQGLYLVSFNNFMEFLQAGGSVAGEQTGNDEQFTGDLVFAANGMEIPLYRQGGGQPWSNTPYGSGTIAGYGCAPTSLAMVITYLTGDTVTPDKVVDWTGNRYYQAGAGSTWSIFGACADHWGLECINLGKNTALITGALENGNPVIASMGPGTFTKGGHLIVLRGITSTGKILVNDPSDNATKNHLNKEFNLDLIMRESKNFWSFK